MKIGHLSRLFLCVFPWVWTAVICWVVLFHRISAPMTPEQAVQIAGDHFSQLYEEKFGITNILWKWKPANAVFVPEHYEVDAIRLRAEGDDKAIHFVQRVLRFDMDGMPILGSKP